jgi:hypothetical protein
LALALVVASCGSDDSSGDTGTGGETPEAAETEIETADGGEGSGRILFNDRRPNIPH